MLRKTLTLTALVSATQLGMAFQIRTYDSDDHDRFDGTIATPTKNPNQLFANLDLSGLGWRNNVSDIGCGLVTRQHVLFATHFSGEFTSVPLRFLSTTGQVVGRTSGTQTVIFDNDQPSDVMVVKLSSPIDTSSSISPLPYLDLNQASSYEGLTIGVVGQGPTQNAIPVIGRDTIFEVENTSRIFGTLNPTRYMSFTFRTSGFFLPQDEGFFETGDSGSPSFVEVNGEAAIVGLHSYVTQDQSPPFTIRNYDAFIPHYISQIDAVLAPDGYRMRPVNAPSTTLAGTSAFVEVEPRQAQPLTLEFDIDNTGANLTGNLEVEFHFAAGEAPDSITAPGWVTYGSNTKWTLRKATMASSEDHTLTASWAAAPIAASVSPNLIWRSDTVGDQSITPSITLNPSFAAWADGLSEAGENDDPDKDQLVNVLEYGLGGDAESGVMLLEAQEPLLPAISLDNDMVHISHPQRTDKAIRGLSYILEYSADLSDWSTTPPAGFSVNTAAFTPAIAGFEKSTSSWPASDSHRFVRLRIELNE